MEENINFSFPFSKTLLKWVLKMSILESFCFVLLRLLVLFGVGFFCFLMSFLSFTGVRRDFFVCFCSLFSEQCSFTLNHDTVLSLSST